jgi:hypothetical protein
MDPCLTPLNPFPSRDFNHAAPQESIFQVMFIYTGHLAGFAPRAGRRVEVKSVLFFHPVIVSLSRPDQMGEPDNQLGLFSHQFVIVTSAVRRDISEIVVKNPDKEHEWCIINHIG